MVVFYRHGDINMNDATLGHVTKFDPRTGNVSITLVVPDFHRDRVIEDRPHIDDPIVKKNPDVLKYRGCWDLRDNHVLRVHEREQERRDLAKQEIQAKKDREERQEFERLVVRMAQDGKDAEAIAKELTVKKEDVQKVMASRNIGTAA